MLTHLSTMTTTHKFSSQGDAVELGRCLGQIGYAQQSGGRNQAGEDHAQSLGIQRGNGIPIDGIVSQCSNDRSQYEKDQKRKSRVEAIGRNLAAKG